MTYLRGESSVSRRVESRCQSDRLHGIPVSEHLYGAGKQGRGGVETGTQLVLKQA